MNCYLKKSKKYAIIKSLLQFQFYRNYSKYWVVRELGNIFQILHKNLEINKKRKLFKISNYTKHLVDPIGLACWGEMLENKQVHLKTCTC